MHRLLLIVVFISSALALHDLMQDLALLSSGLPVSNFDFGSKRAKREIRSSNLTDPDNCIRNCSMNSANAAIKATNGTISCENDPLEACYKKCPSSVMRTIIIDSLPVSKMSCLVSNSHQIEAEKVFRCLNTTNDKVSAKCDPLCNMTSESTKFWDSFDFRMSGDQAFLSYDDDKAKNANAFKADCKNLMCRIQCGEPIVKQTCGQAGLDMQRNITSVSLGTIMKIYIDLKALDGQVKECEPLL